MLHILWLWTNLWCFHYYSIIQNHFTALKIVCAPTSSLFKKGKEVSLFCDCEQKEKWQRGPSPILCLLFSGTDIFFFSSGEMWLILDAGVIVMSGLRSASFSGKAGGNRAGVRTPSNCGSPQWRPPSSSCAPRSPALTASQGSESSHATFFLIGLISLKTTSQKLHCNHYLLNCFVLLTGLVNANILLSRSYWPVES